jgi:hypothetical protein
MKNTNKTEEPAKVIVKKNIDIVGKNEGQGQYILEITGYEIGEEAILSLPFDKEFGFVVNGDNPQIVKVI